jgi:hypothetical protein
MSDYRKDTQAGDRAYPLNLACITVHDGRHPSGRGRQVAHHATNQALPELLGSGLSTRGNATSSLCRLRAVNAAGDVTLNSANCVSRAHRSGRAGANGPVDTGLTQENTWKSYGFHSRLRSSKELLTG